MNGLGLLHHTYHITRQSRHPFAHHHRPRRKVRPGPWRWWLSKRAAILPALSRGIEEESMARGPPDSSPIAVLSFSFLASFPTMSYHGNTTAIRDQCNLTRHMQYSDCWMVKSKERSKRLSALRCAARANGTRTCSPVSGCTHSATNVALS